MTKQEVLNLFNGLNKVGSLVGVKFAYGVSKNIAKLKLEVDALEKSLEASEAYKTYDQLRIELCKEHAKKDTDDKPIIKDNNYVMESDDEFEAEFEILKEENHVVIAAREAQLEEYRDLLKTDVSVDLHKIKLEDVPAEITTAEMFGILPIIED